MDDIDDAGVLTEPTPSAEGGEAAPDEAAPDEAAPDEAAPDEVAPEVGAAAKRKVALLVAYNGARVWQEWPPLLPQPLAPPLPSRG